MISALRSHIFWYLCYYKLRIMGWPIKLLLFNLFNLLNRHKHAKLLLTESCRPMWYILYITWVYPNPPPPPPFQKELWAWVYYSLCSSFVKWYFVQNSSIEMSTTKNVFFPTIFWGCTSNCLSKDFSNCLLIMIKRLLRQTVPVKSDSITPVITTATLFSEWCHSASNRS